MLNLDNSTHSKPDKGLFKEPEKGTLSLRVQVPNSITLLPFTHQDSNLPS